MYLLTASERHGRIRDGNQQHMSDLAGITQGDAVSL